MSDRPVSSQVHSAPQGLISIAEAHASIAAQVTPLGESEPCPLAHALGRTLASAVHSPIPVPAFDNSAMDGYALHPHDAARNGPVQLTIIGSAYAGTPFDGTLAEGQAVRIMTGAALPSGADTVVMQEQVTVDGAHLSLTGPLRAGDNVRRRAEELAEGDAVLPAGHRLRPADLALLATLGVAEVRVVRRVKVALFSTGDELRPLGAPLGAGQIYDANRYGLGAELREAGAEVIDLGIIPDRREAVEAAFTQASEVADLVLTSGGVSVGDADYVQETLQRLGQVGLWRIAIKPGKPLAFGRLGSALFFGLPGNPVSAMVTFHEFVLPALRRLQGEQARHPLRLRLPVTHALKKRPGRADYQRGQLHYSEAGELQVTGLGAQGSHRLTSLSRADCLIILPPECAGVEAGALVEVEPLGLLT